MSVAPGYNSRALLGQLLHIRDDTLGFLLESAGRFGDLTRFEAGKQAAFLVNQPDLIKHVLQDNHANYSKNTIQYNALASITGRGLLTSDNAGWLRNRRLAQPAFARPRLAALDQVVLPATDAALARWQSAPDGIIDVDAEMMKLTLEVVGKALFSIDLSASAQRLTGAVLTALDHIVHRARHPISLPDAVPTPRNRRFKAALRTLDEAVYGMMAARRASGQPGGDLMGMLLQACDEETGQGLTDREVRDEIITLLIAGHETVASALTWAWYLLAHNPARDEQMRAEVRRVLAGRAPTSADLPNLPMVNQVFSEALRLYPPAWLITRQARAADTLGGYAIPAGALMIISPYTMHRHAQYWPEPERFDPARFAEPAVRAQHRFAYIPFGGGPRLCIGNHFAALEAALILARVSQCYHLELLAGHTVQVDALVTLRPRGGLPMRLAPDR